jgi:hypothetical protein
LRVSSRPPATRYSSINIDCGGTFSVIIRLPTGPCKIHSMVKNSGRSLIMKGSAQIQDQILDKELVLGDDAYSKNVTHISNNGIYHVCIFRYFKYVTDICDVIFGSFPACLPCPMLNFLHRVTGRFSTYLPTRYRTRLAYAVVSRTRLR